MTSPIPDDSTRTRQYLIAGVLALVVVLVGVGAFFAYMATRPAKPVTVAPAIVATSSSGSQLASGSAETSSASESASSTALDATSTASTESSSHPGQVVRAAKLAYRQAGRIWVADENGSHAVPVIRSTDGEFALSPDGRTVVLIDPTVTGVQIADVATGRIVRLAHAATGQPAWSPDSSWFAYTANESGKASVRRVARDGSGDTILCAQGSNPQISVDGARVAYFKTGRPESDDPVEVLTLTGRGVTEVPKSAGALSYAFASGGVLYFSVGTAKPGSAALMVADKALAQASLVASIPSPSGVLYPGQPVPSPNGTKVQLAMTGDDLYSRLQVVDASTKTVTAVPSRRDTYPVGWSLDGSLIFYVEWDAGENPTIYSARSDGTHRTAIVVGGSY